MATEVEDILERVAAAYAGCRSYRDAGTVTMNVYGAGPHTSVKRFLTRFVRPSGFRFEVRSFSPCESGDLYAVWLEEGISKTWWSMSRKLEEVESFASVMNFAAGMSFDAVSRIAEMLLPRQLDRPRTLWPAAAKLITLHEANAAGCAVVVQTRRDGTVVQLWVDRATFLLRRVVEPRHRIVGFSTEEIERFKALVPEAATTLEASYNASLNRGPEEQETTTTYDPEFDAEIAANELLFEPPAK